MNKNVQPLRNPRAEIFTPSKNIIEPQEAERPPVSFDEELSTVQNIGILICKDSGERKVIEITEANCTFFTKNGLDYPVIKRARSQLLVDALEFEKSMQADGDPPKAFAMFDTAGNYTENMYFMDINLDKTYPNGIKKHTAYFSVQSGESTPDILEIAIDDIHDLHKMPYHLQSKSAALEKAA